MRLGSARHPHVLRVRSGGCALPLRLTWLTCQLAVGQYSPSSRTTCTFRWLCAVRPQSDCAADGLIDAAVRQQHQRPEQSVRV
ncbi:TPA: hypothetical protein JD264_17095 [Serratia fonticola]|nr:hypothetical protein [Serratia fonticola]